MTQSLEFLGIEHGFRWMTEDGTRSPHSIRRSRDSWTKP